MLQANPNLGARDVQEILALTATMAGTNTTADANAAYSYNGSTLWNGGGMHESYDYGFGEVDAEAAVRLAKTWKPQDTFNNESFTEDQQSINGYQSESGIYNGSATYNANSGNGLAANNHGFTADSTGLLIPDAGSGAAPYVDFAVGSLPSASSLTAEHVYLTLDIAFPTLTNAANQLTMANALLAAMTVTLTSGDGTVSTLMSPVTAAQTAAGAQTPNGAVVLSGQTTPVFQYTFDTVRDWNENANQDYRVSVTYASGTSNLGEIQSAQLQVFGDTSTAGAGQTHYYTNEFGSLSTDPNNAARGTLTDTGTGVTLNAAATSTNDTLDLAAGSTDSSIAGRALTISSGTTVTTAAAGSGNDLVVANNAGDTIYAGSGNDALVAGSGADTFVLTANSGQQQIDLFTPGQAGDAVNFAGTGATTVKLTTVAGKLTNLVGLDASGNVVTASGTGGEISQAGPGTGWTLLKAVDTNGDGLADLLWENTTSGQVQLWTAIGTGYVNRGNIDGTTSMTGWTLLAADAATSGQPAQLIWTEPNGSAGTLVRSWTIDDNVVSDAEYYSNGSAYQPNSNSTASQTQGINTAVSVMAADINGDGHTDIIFRWAVGSNVALAAWELSGNNVLAANNLFTTGGTAINGTNNVGLSSNFVIFGSADFNGDGTQDLLLEDTSTGNLNLLLMGTAGNSLQAMQSISGTSTLANGYSVIATANLNANASRELIERASGSGAIHGTITALAFLAQTSTLVTTTLGVVTDSAQFIGAADLNGDGKTDLVWQDSSTHVVSIWWGGVQSNSSTIQLTTQLSSVAALASTLNATQLTYESAATAAAASDLVGMDASGNVVTASGTGSEISQSGPGAGWTLLKAVDTNGDGLADLLWENTSSGQVQLWTATGTGYTNRGNIDGTTSMTGWTLLAADAATSTQPAQLIWTEPNGSTGSLVRSWSIADNVVTDSEYYSNGAGFQPNSSSTASQTQGINTTDTVTAADINGDGHSDVIFRWTVGSNVAFAVWELSGSNIVYTGYLSTTSGAAINGTNNVGLSSTYCIMGAADFNGDGKQDLLLEDMSNGNLNLLLMGGGTNGQQAVDSFTGSSSLANGYSVIATANLNGTGDQQLIERAAGSGTVHGTVIAVSLQASGIVTTGLGIVTDNSRFVGAADLNGDGTTDLVWQDSKSNVVSVWWSGLQRNSSTIQLATQLSSVSALADVLPATQSATGTATLQGVAPGQLSLYNNIIGATTLDDSALPGSLTIDLRLPSGETATPLAHLQSVIGNNAGDTIYANASSGGTLTGGTGNDTLTGGAGNDILSGGGGTNTLAGGGGTDSYWISATDVDTINNGVSTSNTAAGQVDFLGSLTDENLWFQHTGNNLIVDVVGTSKTTTLNNFYTSGDTYAQVSQFDAGSLKLDTQLATLVQAMATYSANNGAFNPQTATAMPTDTNLQNAIAAAWHS